MKTFTTICYQQCITTIISYSYTHKSSTSTTRDGLIQGERRRSGASFLQTFTRLNFFNFQIFENLSFNDFSIVIENSPESNGYIFLSMTWKFWRFSTFNQTTPNIEVHRDPTLIKFKNFLILPTQRSYWIIRTIRRHFCDVKTLKTPLKTVPFTVAWYYIGGSLQYLFNIKTDTTY